MGGFRKVFKNLELNPENLQARHWYTLLLMALKRTDEGFAQSTIVHDMDKTGNYLVARASIFYFLEDFEEMKPLMYEALEKDSLSPWTLDWLGMAYNGLEEHDDALETYLKAFNLSDGTVEVGGGLGHALGEAGEYELAKEMANFYDEAQNKIFTRLPACFHSLGYWEYDKAMSLIEQAITAPFLQFMQIEHWYNQIRNTDRFKKLENKMNFP